MIHFYHLWLGGDWKTIAAEHFAALRAAEFPGAVRVGLVGSREAREEAENWLDRQWNYGIANYADAGFEEVTLHALVEYARVAESGTPILYAHNKGAFHPQNGVGVNENTPWRREMTDHLVGSWRERVDELAGYDVTAWRWLMPGDWKLPNGEVKPNPYPLAFGNFWWARAGYLKKLPELPDVLTEGNRIEAEFWVGRNDPQTLGVAEEWPSVEVQYRFIPDGSGMLGSGQWVPID